MPQFDTFIFSSNLLYLILTFFTLLFFSFNTSLPQFNSILKLRIKLFTVGRGF